MKIKTCCVRVWLCIYNICSIVMYLCLYLNYYFLVGGVEADKEGVCYEGHQEGSCIRRRGGHYIAS